MVKAPNFKRASWSLIAAVMLMAFVPELGRAADGRFEEGFGANFGVSESLGRMGNDDRGLVNRNMESTSVEGLVGYRFADWLVGVDVDYRWTRQLTSIEEASSTNWKGKGWLLGLGATYYFNQQWAVQGGVDFIGRYSFDNNSSTGQDDDLREPIVLRIKPQYFPFENLPLSIDLDLQGMRYRKLHIGGTDFDQKTTGGYIGVGLTWHFGADSSASAAPAEAKPVAQVMESPVAPTPPAEPSPADALAQQQQELAKVVDVTKTESGLLVNLKGDVSFKSGSAELSSEAQETIRQAAAILARNANNKIQVLGHTDSSGQKAKNMKLSKARAEAVRNLLIKNGVKATQVSAQGMGDTKPLADNKDAEGRAQNRRVEIYINNEG